MDRTIKQVLIWIMPAVLLLVTLLPLPLNFIFMFLLQTYVTLCAILITYFLFTQKPKYYIPWGIAFIIIALAFNPIVRLNVVMGVAIPLTLLIAIIFIANWWFVFRNRV